MADPRVFVTRRMAQEALDLLATELELRGKGYIFYSYDSDNHFLQGEEQELAVSRDVAFFRSLMKESE